MDSLLKSVESKIVSFGEYFLGYFRIMPEKYLLFFPPRYERSSLLLRQKLDEQRWED